MNTIQRRYPLRWELLGDIDAGRPNLGRSAPVEIYRLMVFSVRDVLEQRYGADAADTVLREAGYLAGKAFYEHRVQPVGDFNQLVVRLQEVLRETGIGILRIEEADLVAGRIVLTISEDLDCSGLPELDTEYCAYDEGFVAAILESFVGRAFDVREIDCWCTGDRTCRFRAEVRG